MTHQISQKHRLYFDYLQNHSFLGSVYRNYLLYPFLRKIMGPVFLDVGCGAGLFLSQGSPYSFGLDVNQFCVDYLLG